MLNISVTEALLSCLSRALGNYHTSKGILHPPAITAALSLDLKEHPNKRSPALSTSNEWLLYPINLPTYIDGVIPTLWNVRCQMDRLKHGYEHAFEWRHGQQFRNFFFGPHAMGNYVTRRKCQYATVMVSSLLGPKTSLSIRSNKILNTLPFVTPVGEIPLSLTILTIEGKISLGLVVDSGCKFVDGEALLRDLCGEMRNFLASCSYRRPFDSPLVSWSRQMEDEETGQQEVFCSSGQQVKRWTKDSAVFSSWYDGAGRPVKDENECVQVLL